MIEELILYLSKEIRQFKIDMDSRHFRNKVNFSNTFQELTKEQNTLKRERVFFNFEEMRTNIYENTIPINKKIKLENSFLNNK